MGNVYRTCPEHASRPQARYLEMADEVFLGNYVKLGFRIQGKQNQEHCWVLVKKIVGQGWFSGTLDNEPVGSIGYRLGDRVRFRKQDIEAALSGESGEEF